MLMIRPTIRYSKSGLCSSVAKRVYEAQKKESTPTKCNATLLIVDRSIDIQAALLHESTIEALVCDVIDGYDLATDTITSKGVDNDPPKQRLLHDAGFHKLKYVHFLDARKQLNQDLEAFAKQHESLSKVQRGQGAELEVQDMVAAIRAVPEFQEQYHSFESNVTIIKEIMTELERRNVIVQKRTDNKFQQNVGTIESELATGITDSAKETKVISMTSMLTTFFRASPELPSEIKIRLIMLYVALFEVNGQSQDAIIDAAGLCQSDRAMVRKFSEIGLCSEVSKSGLRRTKSQLNLAKKDLNNQTNVIARFTTRLKTLMERAIDNLLDTENFPGFGGENVTPNTTSMDGRNWGWKNVNAGGSDKAKLIVFVVGGVTLSEIRDANLLMKTQSKCDIVIGGTSILTPNTLIQSLRRAVGVDTNTDDVCIDVKD